jgi:hypothetical protein
MGFVLFETHRRLLPARSQDAKPRFLWQSCVDMTSRKRAIREEPNASFSGPPQLFVADGFSVQISCTEDPRFWFRMVPTPVPKITDFLLGEFPPETSAELLARCCKRIEHPRPTAEDYVPLVIFSNLESDDEFELHTNLVAAALASSNRKIVHTHAQRMARRPEKFELYLFTGPSASK